MSQTLICESDVEEALLEELMERRELADDTDDVHKKCADLLQSDDCDFPLTYPTYGNPPRRKRSQQRL